MSRDRKMATHKKEKMGLMKKLGVLAVFSGAASLFITNAPDDDNVYPPEVSTTQGLEQIAAAPYAGAKEKSSQSELQELVDNFNQTTDYGIEELTLVVEDREYIFKGTENIGMAIEIAQENDGQVREAKLAILAVASNLPISYDILVNLAASESGFDNTATSPQGARGLFQFLPDTYLEYLYKYGDLLPPEYSGLQDHVERYTKYRDENNNPILGYRVQSGSDKDMVLNSMEVPIISATLGGEVLLHGLTRVEQDLERINAMEAHLNRPLNATDVKITHFLGRNGATKLLLAYADPEKLDHRALDYALKSTVDGNPNIFYKDGAGKQHPRSISELYEEVFTGMMGNEQLPIDLKRKKKLAAQTARSKNTSPTASI
jgi:hypothetical protein